MVTAYLGLGSNLGDREAALAAAVEALRAHGRIRVLLVSRWIETEPVGGPPGQGPFLNGAAAIETDLGPEELMAALKAVERDLGRKDGPRWGARLIDLDILFHGRVVMKAPGLSIPHPLLAERRFVLEPLSEIAPDFADPVTGRTVRQLLEDLDSRPR